ERNSEWAQTLPPPEKLATSPPSSRGLKGPGDQEASGAMEVPAVMQQPEELDHAAQRSVAAEVESALESGLGDEGDLVGVFGRARALDARGKIWQSRINLAAAGKRPKKKQQELQNTDASKQDWQAAQEAPDAAASSSWIAPRAANLHPARGTVLMLNERTCCLLFQEEMGYDMGGAEPGTVGACADEAGGEVNRFAGDWATLRHVSQQAARSGWAGDDIRALAPNGNAPQLIRDVLNIVQMAAARVFGADGRRRPCRREGNALATIIGPPLEFCAVCTPNLAGGSQPRVPV
ncbi:unnamed protein product, partial [Prorocentrum cordatum]